MTKNAITRKTILTLAVPASIAAGFANGLLGTGGGVIMFLTFRALSKKSTGITPLSERDVFASVIAVILPVSVVSALTYAANGRVNFDEVAVMTIPAVIGGLFGAHLTDKLNTDVLKAIFAVILIISGIRMLTV